jgi:hypothetical protein
MLKIGALLFVLAVQEGAKPLPDLQTFLSDFRKSLHTDDLLLSNYTYTEKRTTVELDSNRKPKKTEVDVFQVIPGTCDRPEYRRQTVKDGVPVPQSELEKQDREHQKEVSDARSDNRSRRLRRRNNCRDLSAEDRDIISDLFGVYDIRIVGREAISGESAVILTFKPRPNYKPKTRQGEIMKHVEGRAWVSEADHQLARLDAEVVDNISFGLLLAKLQKGSRIFAERRKFNNEVWLPARVEVSVAARLLLVKGVNMKETIEYSDHKKFTVDTILKFPDVDSR